MLSLSNSIRVMACSAAIIIGTNSARAELIRVKDMTLPQYPSLFAALRGEFDVTVRAMVLPNNDVAQVEWLGAESLRTDHAGILESGSLRNEILATVKQWHIQVPGFENTNELIETRPVTVKLRYRLIDDPGRGNCYDEEKCTTEYLISQTNEIITVTIKALVVIHIN